MNRRLLLAACLLPALAACRDPAPTETPDPPEPQAAATAAAAPEHTELRDAIQEPLDKARAAEDAQAERDAERERALEDAGG